MNALQLPFRSRPILIILGLFALGAGVAGAFFMRSAPAPAITSYAACAEAGYPVSLTNPPVCTHHNRSFVGPTTTPAASPAPALQVPFELLVQGNSGGAYPAKQEVITTQAGWTTYWAQVHANIKPLPPLLPVNFQTANVVAVSLGQRPTGGYSLKATSIDQLPSGTTVNLTQTAPGPGCITAQSFTNPYLIIQTPVLTQPVYFRITEQKHTC
jgi:hypothetical protein